MITRFHRSFYGKVIVLAVVLSCFFLYLKVMSSNLENLGTKDHPKASRFHQKSERTSNEIFDNEILPPGTDEENVFDKPRIDDNPYERQIQADLAKQVPGLGDDGSAVHLEGEQKIRGDEIYKKIALNVEVSEQLSYNRTTPEARNPKCRDLSYDIASLPTASVVIIFFNEPYSVLVRTVHSTINTADKRNLKEIILVDDGSTDEELKGKLDYYVATRFPKGLVKINRLKNRLGLIRARLAGARVATGDVLIFLDAHCEGVRGWMEALLARIKESPTSVLVPIIDVIDSKDFQYSTNGFNSFQIGGFSWNGHFDWVEISERERERQRRECKEDPEVCPTYSPTMAGGLFAIDRKYFWEVGSYDEQMDGWGGENLEMSFRIWQCGGTIETIPCSRVGHVFRDFHPYSFPNDRDTHGINTARMALVWMDDYMNLFFLNRPDLKFHPDIGDVTHRVMLRKKLKCKNFDWFLKNVYPEKFIPTKNVQGYGKIRAVTTNLCLDDLSQNNDKPFNLGVYFCSPTITRSQFFSFTNTGELRNEMSCATVQRSSSPPYLVVMNHCNVNSRHNDHWEYANEQFIHIKSKMCLDHRGLKYQDYLEAAPCDVTSETQKWRFENDISTLPN